MDSSPSLLYFPKLQPKTFTLSLTLLSGFETIFSLISQESRLAGIRGMTALSGWPGCDVRVSQGTHGTSPWVHRWAWSQTGNATPESWDKTWASILKLVLSSRRMISDHHVTQKIEGIVWRTVTFGRPAFVYQLCYFCYRAVVGFGLCVDIVV